MSKIIFIQGLPGSGKTTMARAVAEKLGAVHINADWARETVTKHLGFGPDDRVRQARTLAQMARMVFEQGPWVVVDFVCPTRETRAAFYQVLKNGKADTYSVWMNTIESGRFEDTNRLYQKPGVGAFDLEVSGWKEQEDFAPLADQIVKQATEGHRSYYVRYNTASDGKTKHWRIIDAETKAETLVDDFELRGHMTPGSTIEHDVLKWNVLVRGYGQFVDTEAEGDFRINKFILSY